MRTTTTLSIIAAALAFTGACGSTPEPVAVRLVDLFEPDVVAGSPVVDPPARTEWRFDGALPDDVEVDFADTGGVEAGPGVSGLEIRDGRLVGRTTTDFPLLRVARAGDLDAQDQVYAIEVRMRVSDGANLQVEFSADETVVFPALQGAMAGSPFAIRTPIVAGDDLQTYTLTPVQNVAGLDGAPPGGPTNRCRGRRLRDRISAGRVPEGTSGEPPVRGRLAGAGRGVS